MGSCVEQKGYMHRHYLYLNKINIFYIVYHLQRNKSSDIPIGVYVDGELTNYLDLVIKQWLTEYKSLYTTINIIITMVIICKKNATYHVNLSNHQDGNIMLNEPISYKEVEFAIKNLNVRKACGVNAPQQLH